MNQSVKEKVIELFKSHFRVAESDIHKKQGQLAEWTSLKHVTFFVKLEKEFSIRFTGGEISRADDLKSVVLLVEAKAAK